MTAFFAGVLTCLAIELIILAIYAWPLVVFVLLVFLDWIRGRRWDH
jgi:hypothetical protein